MSTSTSLKAYTNPTVLKQVGLQILGGTSGLVIANQIDKRMNAQKGLAVPLAILAGGVAGIVYYFVNPPKSTDKLGSFLQGTSVGAAVVGGLKSMQYGVEKLSIMSGLGRLRGFISPELLEKFKATMPTINGMGEVPSYNNDPMASMMGLGNYYTTNYYEPEPSNNVLTAKPINGYVEAIDVMSEVR
ncbi:MAG: hypothetical protein F9K23_11635 [Bacteroidetes bacterium]|nr:MAG: hypothetical protein F9K23_11635 [Bacteroidota bacterium]